MISVFLKPRIVPKADTSEPRGSELPVYIPATSVPDYDIRIPDVARPVTTAMAVGTTAPQLMDIPPDSAPLAVLAGLRPGEGVTVVARLEILDSGDIGDIVIESPGPSEAINQCAIEYVRLLHWSAGMIDGRPTTLWVRWPIRLQA